MDRNYLLELKEVLFSLAQRLKREISLIPRRNTSPCCWNMGCSAKGLPAWEDIAGFVTAQTPWLWGGCQCLWLQCGWAEFVWSWSLAPTWSSSSPGPSLGIYWEATDWPLATPLVTNLAKRPLWGPIPALTKTQTASWLATPQGLPQTEGYRAHGCCWGPSQTTRQDCANRWFRRLMDT